MQPYLLVNATMAYIECRLQAGFTYEEMAARLGYSLPHLRAVFARTTGKSLGRYALERRIAAAAFDAVHTQESLLSIGERYGFDNPDTFARAFRRVMGMSPRELRKQRVPMGRKQLAAGIYGVSERMNDMKDTKQVKTQGSTILYGVPKVGYGVYGACTPYPIALKAYANYLGEDIDYDLAMVTCGAAFRLTWNEHEWDDGNVDVCFAFDDYEKIYRHGVEGLGRKMEIINREADSTKEGFIAFARHHLDAGMPLFSAGIIGPPEIGLVTGYQEDGNTLLGWSFFQDFPEFGGGCKTDENGYYICDNWWEERYPERLFTMGEEIGPRYTTKQIVALAIEVLSPRRKEPFAKGLLAYDAWKRMLLDDKEFPPNMIAPLLVERLMCQSDAMDCLADGRYNAGSYFKKLSDAHPDQPLYAEISRLFTGCYDAVKQMADTLGGWDRGEAQMQRLQDPAVRKQLGTLIDRCKENDTQALALLQQLHAAL